MYEYLGIHINISGSEFLYIFNITKFKRWWEGAFKAHQYAGGIYPVLVHGSLAYYKHFSKFDHLTSSR